MRKFTMQMIRLSAICLVVASCVPKGVDPCDVLVNIAPKPETNQYLVSNDKPAAVNIARSRERFTYYKCGVTVTDSRK